MRRGLISVGLLLLCHALCALGAVIPEDCSLVCKDPAVSLCFDACAFNITQKRLPFYGAPWLNVTRRFDMGVLREHITGCGAPLGNSRTNVYFTTLEGSVYHYQNSTNTFYRVLNISDRLDRSNGKGLYDIAFNRYFLNNGLFYLSYSKPAEKGRRITLSSNIRSGGSVKTTYQFPVDHYTAIQEYKKAGASAVAIQDIHLYEQIGSNRTGGWLGQAIPQGYAKQDPLYIAIGGNSEENILYGSELVHMSSIRRLDTADPAKVDDQWASGASDPISCTVTSHLSAEVYCLVRLYTGDMAVYRIKYRTNIGSSTYVERCESLACRNHKKYKSTQPVATFSKSACPATSIIHYTGYQMDLFKLDVFISQDACYNPSLGIIEPARLLRVVKNSTSGQFYASEVPSYFEDPFLIDTKLVGADKHDDFFLTGLSLKTGKVTFYSIDPVRAANDYAETEYYINDEHAANAKKRR